MDYILCWDILNGMFNRSQIQRNFRIVGACGLLKKHLQIEIHNVASKLVRIINQLSNPWGIYKN